MTKNRWKNRITEYTKEAGTYRPYFDDVIITLAEILANRDDTAKQYRQTGSMPVVKYTNKGGNTNPTKNPILSLWDDLNKTALMYWRELGLTPAGLKRLDDTALKNEKKDAFADALGQIIG